MGCTSSKVEVAAADVYRPAATSFAVFDINSVREPWLATDEAEEDQHKDEKPVHVPTPLLEKLNALEDSPGTWDEVSKDLEDLKPTLRPPAPPPPDNKPTAPSTPPAQDSGGATAKKVKRKSFSFHTLEELDTKTTTKSKTTSELRKTESMNELNPFGSRLRPVKNVDSNRTQTGSVESDGYKPVRENIFLLRDRMEREKEGKEPGFVKRDPLGDYPELVPPGGRDGVVVYTTSLGGVRRTYEDCNRVRSILELHRVKFDERDVSLHGGFLNELKELVGEEGARVPRLFVKGRYLGGVDEVGGLNETGRLRRIWNYAGVERGVGRQGCEGCGGARFVPCLDCGGSCKVVVGDKRERCPECNENGLVYCPACL